MGFAENLRQLRKQNGLTQEALSELSGVSCNSIINYEGKRRTNPPIATMQQLANALDVDIDRLVGDGCDLEERKKMKLWKLMVPYRPYSIGTEEREALRTFARKIRMPGTKIRHAYQEKAAVTFVITDDNATAMTIDAAWKIEHGDITRDDDAMMFAVDRIPEDANPRAYATYFNMNIEAVEKMLDEVRGECDDEVLSAQEEATERKGAPVEFSVHGSGMKELLDDLREAVALMERLKKLAGSLELVIEHK